MLNYLVIFLQFTVMKPVLRDLVRYSPGVSMIPSVMIPMRKRWLFT